MDWGCGYCWRTKDNVRGENGAKLADGGDHGDEFEGDQEQVPVVVAAHDVELEFAQDHLLFLLFIEIVRH